MNNGYQRKAATEENGLTSFVLKCNGNRRENSTINYVRNPYINEEDDVLFHLTLSNKTHDLEAMFHDVKLMEELKDDKEYLKKSGDNRRTYMREIICQRISLLSSRFYKNKFVCMGGTAHRMKEFARFLMEEFQYPAEKKELEDLTGSGHRYSMFKVGCVLCVNHGMGYPSIMILLHELIKLMQYAKVRDPIFFRLGTSGGIDVPSGTVVIATKALNDFMEPYFEVPILGQKHQWICTLDQKLAHEIKTVAEKECNFPVMLGCTVSSEQFYESTAMKAGAICEHSDEDRRKYYHKLKSNNVLNMDMESIALSSITHKVGIKAAIINVVVNDAFTEEEDAPSAEELKIWQKRPQIIAAEYIKRYCSNNNNNNNNHRYL